jgi:threonine synthase
VTVATLAQLAQRGVINPNEKTVAIISGHGLKTVEALTGHVDPNHTIPATLDAFDAAVGFDDPLFN